MACKYIYEGVTYQSKQDFIDRVINPQFIKGRTLAKREIISFYESDEENYNDAFLTQGEEMGLEEMPSKEEIERRKNKSNFVKGDDTSKQESFLHLLSRDNNWVTFFVKSIIQDTAKQTITEVQQEDVEAKVRELEKEGLLEIDCKGKLKAEKGLTTSFTKGGTWKVIKDLKGYPTHKEGGVDLTIGKDGVSIKNGNTEFTAKHGLVIPKN